MAKINVYQKGELIQVVDDDDLNIVIKLKYRQGPVRFDPPLRKTANHVLSYTLPTIELVPQDGEAHDFADDDDPDDSSR